MRFLPLLSALMSLANVDIGGAVSRRARGVGYTVTAIIFLLTAYVLAVGALAFFLAGHMSTWAALAITALGFFGMAGIVFWFAGMSARAEDERARQVAAARQEAALGSLTGLALDGGSTKTLIIAALAGVLAGRLFGQKGSDPAD
jgi:hypothetical protein